MGGMLPAGSPADFHTDLLHQNRNREGIAGIRGLPAIPSPFCLSAFIMTPRSAEDRGCRRHIVYVIFPFRRKIVDKHISRKYNCLKWTIIYEISENTFDISTKFFKNIVKKIAIVWWDRCGHDHMRRPVPQFFPNA